MTTGTTHPEFDLAILGGGSAGYAAARTAVAAGLRTVVMDGAPELGGLCILRGCMPTKALLYAAEVLHLARSGPAWGLHTQQTGFDFPKLMARKDEVIEGFAAHRRGQLQAGRFELIRHSARFVDPHTLELDDGRRLQARHFVLATGSVVSAPPLPQLSEAGYLTSDDALTLKSLPASLIVLGGGPVAIELAQYFARLDVRVTVIQRSPRILKEFDADAATTLEEALRDEGITLHTGTRLLDAKRQGDQKEVSFEQNGQTLSVQASEVLFALGRSPNVAGLNLEAAGVRVERGRIVTDESMRTSAPHIYAAGDCTGPHEIVHIAIAQAEIAAHNIAHPRARRSIDYRLLINVVFTEPQIAVVGLSEREAEARQIPHVTAQHAFDDHGKSIIMNALDGFVKLLANPDNGEILGGACVGPLGGELIHEIAVAMAGRMTVHQLAAVPHYHPTLAEIWTYPAEDLAGRINPRP